MAREWESIVAGNSLKLNVTASYAYDYHGGRHHGRGRRHHGRGRGNMFSEPVTSFAEDFDFMAMNEKFNKAEVWGQLGKKGKAVVESDERGQSSNVYATRKGEEESLNLKSRPYNKDDFFDNLSYQRPEPSTPSERARVMEESKIDMETFGDFSRQGSNKGGGRRFHGGRWHGSKYDRGKGSNNTRGPSHGSQTRSHRSRTSGT